MEQQITITYYHHSGFSAAVNNRLLVFDYWRGEHGEVPEEKAITAEVLAQYEKVYVLLSHEHQDHFDEIVYEWRKLPGVDVTYIVAYDMPVAKRGKRMAPGDTLTFDGMTVTAYESTDLGVSFLVKVDGMSIFHAGDLNFWHWRDESTTREIAEAEEEFQRAVEPIRQENIDVAFFPVDPRQGQMYDAGANYFIMSVKPRLLIPMHYWGRADLANEFARRSRSRQTEILPMTRVGEKIQVDMEEGGYMTVTLLTPETPFRAPEPPAEEPADKPEGPLHGYDGNDPFSDTDLPVSFNEE